MLTAEEICARLDAGSSDYKKTSKAWKRHHPSLQEARTLLLGPGKNADTLFNITLGIQQFLINLGFQVELADVEQSLAHYHELAATFDLILAVPISIGSACEVVDMLRYDKLQDRLVVVLPEEHEESYLGRLVASEGRPALKMCPPVSARNIDKNVGTALLKALVGRVNEQRELDRAAETRSATGPTSEQAKAASADPADIVVAIDPVENPPVDATQDDQSSRRASVAEAGRSTEDDTPQLWRTAYRSVALAVLVVAVVLAFRMGGAAVASVALAGVLAVLLLTRAYLKQAAAAGAQLRKHEMAASYLLGRTAAGKRRPPTDVTGQ